MTTQLTEREQRVISLAVDGLTIGQIAAEVFIGPRAVRYHLASITCKLGALNTTNAAAIAVERGICSPSGSTYTPLHE